MGGRETLQFFFVSPRHFLKICSQQSKVSTMTRTRTMQNGSECSYEDSPTWTAKSRGDIALVTSGWLEMSTSWLCRISVLSVPLYEQISQIRSCGSESLSNSATLWLPFRNTMDTHRSSKSLKSKQLFLICCSNLWAEPDYSDATERSGSIVCQVSLQTSSVMV